MSGNPSSVKHNQESDKSKETPVVIEINPTSTNPNHALYGGLAGLIASTILHPLEVIKIGIIINPMKLQSIETSNFLRSFLIVGSHIKRTEGFSGFFRGLAPEILRSSAGTAIYFEILRILEKIGKQVNIDEQLSQFLSSATARMSSAYLTNPIGVVASRTQVPGFTVYKNMFDGAKKIYKYEGISSFMKGSLASAFKEGPFAGTYYVIYRYMKRKFEQIEAANNYKTLSSFLSGMTAGLIATSVSHPFEIIRARMQIISKFDTNKDYEYKGIMDGFRKIYEHEGMKGYVRGLAPRLVRKPLANSLTFTFFELFVNHRNPIKW